MAHPYKSGPSSVASLSSSRLSLPAKRAGILLVKHIRCGLLEKGEKQPRFPLFGGKSRTINLEVVVNGATRLTTESKIDERGKAIWNEHLSYELAPPIRDEYLRVRCFDMKRKGNEAMIGEARADLRLYEKQENRVIMDLMKHDLSVGQIVFDMYFLSGNPPRNADQELADEAREGDKIGMILLNHISCRGLRKTGHLEFVLNKPKIHSTLRYWKVSHNICKYPISMDMLAKDRRKLVLVIQCRYGPQANEFAKTRFEIGSETNWRKLMRGGPIETGELTFTEGGLDAGYIRFSLSLHEFTSFQRLFEEDEYDSLSAHSGQIVRRMSGSSTTSSIGSDMTSNRNTHRNTLNKLTGKTNVNEEHPEITDEPQDDAQSFTQAETSLKKKPTQILTGKEIVEDIEGGESSVDPEQLSNQSRRPSTNQPSPPSPMSNPSDDDPHTRSSLSRTGSMIRGKTIRSPSNEDFRFPPPIQERPESKIVCSKYVILHAIGDDDEFGSNERSNRYRNRLYKGQHIITSKPVIIKAFSRRAPWETETSFLRELQSSHVKHVVGWEDMEYSHSMSGYISVTSFAGDTLERYQYKIRDGIAIKHLLLSISTALKYFHDKEIAHLDLKPSNIICKQTDIYKIRVCDWESAKRFNDYLLPNGGDNEINPFCSRGFTAPEVVLQNDSDLRVSHAQDIFSLAAIFYFLYNKNTIYESFDDLKNMTSFEHIRGDFSDEQARKLALKMLDFNPAERPTIQRVLDSMYFRGGTNTEQYTREVSQQSPTNTI
ncbi:1016_t:CDS:2 [Ambispora gerdemannii]|uniref:1016_t:CDS:1 n=1 Tax=Ambispora gerdemannii TaxID=144530 RepID=A0A9N9ASL4_9GLOM|nr:1016_t:CDS:2 [Ambispora gerdemannii]